MAGKGLITVKVNKEAGMLVVTVEDNGVGRSATTANKSDHTTSHYSKGMTLTEDRIALMNKLYEGTASVGIMDLKDDHDAPLGTRITIRVPLFGE
jgi:sensor histidine kinase YesM